MVVVSEDIIRWSGDRSNLGRGSHQKFPRLLVIGAHRKAQVVSMPQVVLILVGLIGSGKVWFTGATLSFFLTFANSPPLRRP